MSDALAFPPATVVDPSSVRRHARVARLHRLPLRVLALLVDLGATFAACLAVGADPVQAALTAAVATAALASTRDRGRLTADVGPYVVPIVGRLSVAAVLVGVLPTDVIDTRLALWSVPVAAAGILAGRTAVNGATRAVRRRRLGLEPTVIIGAGPVAVQVAETLAARPEFGLHPIGFLDDLAPDDSRFPHLGPVRDLAAVVLSHDVRRVVLAFGTAREHEMVPVLRDCAGLPFDVHFHALPRFFELSTNGDRRTDDVWGFPLVKLRYGARSRTWFLKRTFDRTVAITLLLLTAPLFAAIALAVKLSSPGPVLFRQKRIGQWGRPFELLKFRTMRENEDSDTTWTVDDDERVTWIGSILRPTHLDELPQLVNVLRGEMSIVGPRPERPVFVDLFNVEVPRYEDRHRVPVGITGWAQVHGLWGDTSIADRARFDNRYIEDWSLWRDLQIVLRTIPTLLGNRDEESAAAVQASRATPGATPEPEAGAVSVPVTAEGPDAA